MMLKALIFFFNSPIFIVVKFGSSMLFSTLQLVQLLLCSKPMEIISAVLTVSTVLQRYDVLNSSSTV